jgi:SAM-dependent methyltransferase
MPLSWHDTPPPERSFDELAESFDRFAELVGGPLEDYLTSVLPLDGGQRAVDLGCGTGRHAQLLAGRYSQVLAVDLSAPMLDFARRRRPSAAIRYQQRDLCEVRADTDGTFDLVLSAYALHHVPDLDQTLFHIRELVAPGGWAILIDNVAPTPAVPRWWFCKEAARTLLGDLLLRRRPPGEAWERYRLNTHPAWLDHLTSDRFLNPEQFTQRYSHVFAGAGFTDLYRTRAMCWHATPMSSRGSPAGRDDTEADRPDPYQTGHTDRQQYPSSQPP